MANIKTEVQGQKAIRKIAEAILGTTAANKSIAEIGIEFTESGGLKWGIQFNNGISIGNEVNAPEQDFLRFSVAFELAGIHRGDWPAVSKFLASAGKGMFLLQLLDLDDDLFDKVEKSMRAIVTRPNTPAAIAVILGPKAGEKEEQPTPEVQDAEMG